MGMPFKNTPAILKADYHSGLDIHALGKYFAMAQDELSHARQLRENNLGLRQQKYFIGAGCNTVQRPPRNLTGDPDEIMALIPETSDQLRSMLSGVRSKAKIKVKIKPPRRGEPDKHDFSRKSEKRLHSKAQEYATQELDEDPFTRVADTVRTTLEVDGPRDLQKVSEVVRPFAHPNMLRYLNSFMQPELSQIRRILINWRAPSGLSTEIVIRDSLASPYYDASEDEQHKERAANQGIVRGSERGLGPSTIRAAGKTSEKSKITRAMLNDHAASLERVSVLKCNFQYFSVAGFPVVINHDGWERKSFALVPDPKTRFWVTDQNFLPLVESQDAEEITSYEAQLRAEALTQCPELHAILSHP